MKIDAILVKPLDGFPVGSPKSFDKADFDRLKTMGAVREAEDGDAVEPEADEYDEMLVRFRDPVQGPVLIRQLRAELERHEQSRSEMAKALDDLHTDLSTVRAERDDANNARSAAVDAERAAVTKINELISEIEQLRAAKSEAAPDNKMSKTPSNKSASADTK